MEVPAYPGADQPQSSPSGGRTRWRRRIAALTVVTAAAAAITVPATPAFAATTGCTIPVGNHYSCKTGWIWANSSQHAIFVSVRGSTFSYTTCRVYDYDNIQQVALISAAPWTTADRTLTGLYNRYQAWCDGSTFGGASLSNG
jgi:hypothetical protein